MEVQNKGSAVLLAGGEPSFSIEDVRDLVRQNSMKENLNSLGESFTIDPELLLLIHSKVSFNVFIDGDSVFSYEELMAAHPFAEYNTSPEKVFVQQEVAVFEIEGGEMEVASRDVGDPSDFVLARDLLSSPPQPRVMSSKVMTRVFIGKDNWNDFKLMKKMVGVFQKFLPNFALIPSSSSDGNILSRITN